MATVAHTGPWQFVQARCAMVAAAVNASIAVVLPLVVLVASYSLDLDRSDATVIARDLAPGHRWLLLPILFRTALMLVPFALLAGWRTWVYARRRNTRADGGWGGVVEAGVCGLALGLMYLAPGIVTRPADAPPYVIVYGGAALLVGVLMGLFLRGTALLVLRLCK